MVYYNATQQQPNITTLAMHGMPAGRGRKGGVPERQRCKGVKAPDIIVSCPATCRRFSSPVCLSQTAAGVQTTTSKVQENLPTSAASDSQSGSGYSAFRLLLEKPNTTQQTAVANDIPPISVHQSASSISAVASSLGSVLFQSQVITFQSPPLPTQTHSF